MSKAEPRIPYRVSISARSDGRCHGLPRSEEGFPEGPISFFDRNVFSCCKCAEEFMGKPGINLLFDHYKLTNLSSSSNELHPNCLIGLRPLLLPSIWRV